MVTNIVKEEFNDIELHDGGGLNFISTRDTQTPRNIDIYGYRGVFFLTFGFKDVQFYKEVMELCLSTTSEIS